MKNGILCFCLGIVLSASSIVHAENITKDICIYGATAGGISAAISAAIEGKSSKEKGDSALFY